MTRRADWDAGRATRFYRRAGFGAPRETIALALDGGPEFALQDLLERRQHEPALQAGINSLLALENIDILQAWWFSLLLADTAPLVERVALMWHNHFATSFDKVGDVRLMHAQIELFRAKGMGDFRELLHAVATDPAMLVWLDGASNKRGQPNENFAREVMELFGLGIGNYDESDIQEAARAFSGWGVKGRQFVYRAKDHDADAKTVFGQSGELTGADVIDLILAQPACARHIARRLLNEFVSATASEDLVARWAERLVQNDWNIARTLEALLRSEDFLTAPEQRITSPVELVATVAISLQASASPARAAEAASRMGQALLRPPSVKGWDGGRTWIHAGNWLARHNYLSELAYGDADGLSFEPERSYGTRKQSRVARAAVELLLPDHAGGATLERIESACEACDSSAQAAQRATALVLTMPEFHLV